MIEALLSNQAEIIEAVMSIVVIASLLVAGTKTPDPSTILGKVYKVVEWASLTFGKAKESGVVVPEKIEVETVLGTTEKVDEAKK
tara:strand:+ start:293 stop:547 length:255 start_codon:yes stop_codon:yes gene_type:complete